MNPTRAIEFFLLKVLGFGLPVGYLLPRLLPAAPQLVLDNSYVVAVVTAAVSIFTFNIIIYPLFFHPLRHLPVPPERERGKLLFESPRGFTALRWMRMYPDAELIKLKSTFGAPILCSGPDALRDILNTHVYDFEKPMGLRTFLARVIGWGLIVVEGAEHKKQRKILLPSFQIRKIRELYPFMWGKTQVLLTELAKDVQKNPIGQDGFGKIEIGEWASKLTLDIIGPIAMGRDFESMTHEHNQVADAFMELLRPSPDRLLFFGLHFVFPTYIVKMFPLANNRLVDTTGVFLRDTCKDIIREKKAAQKSGAASGDHDILAKILEQGELNDTEIMDQMLTFLAAGHETTASALTWACYLCARYPEVQRKLRAEIHERIPSSSSPITHEVLESMPYLNGVCEETQRLYPTVPLTIREAKRPTTVAGNQVPVGSQFMLVPYAINRHPRFWGDNADMIVPERWIDTAPDGTQRPNKSGGTTTNYSEVTFLHGPRSCIGRDFAKAELRCAVAGVLGKYEIELDTQKEPRVAGVVTMKPDGGMFLRFREVKNW